MQKWLKFQFQSKMFNRIIVLGGFTIAMLFLSNTTVFGELNEQIDISKYYDYENFESGFGEVIPTNKMVFEIGKDSTVHVKHVITQGKWQPDSPKLIKTLPGEHSNLEVVDEDGDYLRPISFLGETFEESEYVIVGQKPFHNYDLVVEYDLENFLELDETGIWKKHFQFPHDVEIFVDEEIELIFANSRPVDVSEAKGINCVGCDIVIEFFDDEEIIQKNVVVEETKFEEITKTGQEFTLEFLSNRDIREINFLQQLNYFSFNVSKEQLILIKIPLDLLLSPYHVYLTEIDQDVLVENDKILKHDFGQTETHASVAFKPTKDGVIHIVGSTEMDHEKLVEKLERIKANAKSTEENQGSSLFNPKKAEDSLTQGIWDSYTEEDEIPGSTKTLYEEWEETNPSSNDTTDFPMIGIIVAIIAAIIIGVIIKIKKN
tara:strand:+ start:392 stop:1687 length:1296 start_codon:yes stop_codon:yes gene_type:complete